MAKVRRAAALIAALSQAIMIPAAMVSSAAVAAQSPGTSNVEGVVRDGQGTPLAGARVTITGNASGHSRTVHTDEQGAFSATGLPAGIYTITVTHSGFGTVRYEGMRLVAGGWAQLSAELTARGR
jgi:hypothetical protein